MCDESPLSYPLGMTHRPIPMDPHCASHSGWSLISRLRSAPMVAPLSCPGHTSWPQARAGERERAYVH